MQVLPATVTNISQGMESEYFKTKIVQEAFLFERGFLLVKDTSKAFDDFKNKQKSL